MTVEYLDLSDYLAIAAAVTGLDVTTLTYVDAPVPRRLRSPRPGRRLRRVELHPDFVDKAAVLLVRLAKNHPFPATSGRRGCPCGCSSR